MYFMTFDKIFLEIKIFFFIYIQCVMLLKTHINYQYAIWIIQPFYMTMMIMENKLGHGWVISFNGVFVIELLCMDGVHRTFTQCVTIRDQQWLLWKLGECIFGGYTDQNWQGNKHTFLCTLSFLPLFWKFNSKLNSLVELNTWTNLISTKKY